jgi:ubiquinone biosynthesis protein
MPFRVVEKLLRDEFGVRREDLFIEFDPRPIASGSIASVYRARLQDSRIVAVKVRRPGIASRISADLHLMRAAADFLCHLPPFRLVPLRGLVDEFGACLVRQLDFALEAAANRRLSTALVWEPKVVIPALVENLCGAKVLTMNMIDELNIPRQLGHGRETEALLAALRALYRMIFVEGLVHCDLHQGNMHLLPDGRAVLIDFGFIAELGREDRLKFAEFFYSMSANNGVRCAQIILETAAFCPTVLDYPVFEQDVVFLVNSVAGRNAREFQVADFVFGLFDIQRNHGIRGTTAFMMAIIALLVFEGIAKQIYADLDFQREAYPFILRASIKQPRDENVLTLNSQAKRRVVS